MEKASNTRRAIQFAPTLQTRITTPVVHVRLSRAAALRMLCPAQTEITRGIKATLWLSNQKEGARKMATVVDVIL